MGSHETEGFVRAFGRGLAVVEAMGQGPAHHSIADVAERTKLPRSVARRLLMTLAAQGFAATDGKYFWLTPKTLKLGLSYLYSLPYWRYAQLVLEDLRSETGESCSMAVLDEQDIVYVIRVPARRIISSGLTIGTRIAAHSISLGRVLLAGLPPASLGDYLSTSTLRAFTPKTETSKLRLRRAIERVRADGYAWVDSEFDEAICGIAVPVRDEHGSVVAAINVNLMAGSASEQQAKKQFLAHLRRAAVRIRTGSR